MLPINLQNASEFSFFLISSVCWGLGRTAGGHADSREGRAKSGGKSGGRPGRRPRRRIGQTKLLSQIACLIVAAELVENLRKGRRECARIPVLETHRRIGCRN